MKKKVVTLMLAANAIAMMANSNSTIKGRIIDQDGRALPGATIIIEGTSQGTVSSRNGEFSLESNIVDGGNIVVTVVGYEAEVAQVTTAGDIIVKMREKTHSLDQVEVFGERNRTPEKMDFITRMPLRPSEQLQSISVVSHKMIEQQGSISLADVTKNIVGVSTFATYGGASESLSTRGFRGIPTLKNGIRVHSDFRGQGILSDMQGVESVQVIKGSAAITQGVGNDIGSAGGVVNIATKTPRFDNDANLGLRFGSWGQIRGVWDLQRVLTRDEKLALRFNGAVERSDSYRAHVDKNRIYLNPSLAWKPTRNTDVIVEMDYLHDSRTPDRGTVNLAADSVNALYDMPHNKFLGFETDRILTDQLSYSARINHRLNDNYSLRFVYAGSTLKTDNTGASNSKLKTADKTGEYNLRSRSLGRSTREDKNQLFQMDFIGRDVNTGPIKHTFQVGLDFRRNEVASMSYTSVVIDTIDVLKEIVNKLPQDISLKEGSTTTTYSNSYGVMAQEVMTLSKWAKAIVALRYSFGENYDNSSSGATKGDALNPMAGIILTPYKGIHLFGSFTTTTDLRSAGNLMEDGSSVGASTIRQFETGLKTEFFNSRLRVNLTLFDVLNSNLAYQIYDEAMQATGRYGKAGDLSRRGVEIEVIGRAHRTLQVVAGYAFLDAKYKNSLAFMDGSAPSNAPRHTANGWIYYNPEFLKGVSIGLGAYYVGERPVNDFSMKASHANTTPGVKPFDMKAHTTLNATVGYKYKRASINLIFNNITNAEGYSSYYRGGFINPIDPFNFSTALSYNF
ncbi:MAG: carboxypeptidase-like regulatory domain-containing protein [Bacteroidales bacterium]